MKEVCNHDHKPASTYHPQGNGQIKILNQTLEGMMAKSVDEHQEDWPSKIIDGVCTL